MELRPDGTYNCNVPGCLDDGYILSSESDTKGRVKIIKCEYCHNNTNSRFAIEQVRRRLLGATYDKRYHRYD